MRTFYAVVIAIAAVGSPLSAQLDSAPPGAPTINQSLAMRSAGAPRVSPDGKSVVYEVTRTNWETNAFERELWLVDAGGKGRVRLAGTKGSSFDARWSPDGKWIAFLSNRSPTMVGGKLEDSTEIYLISPTGGEPREVTRVETGVSDFEWAPDGRAIAFTSRDRAPKGRDSTYGDIQVVSSDYVMTHLWMIAVPTTDSATAPTRLTEGNAYTVGDFQWAPDGAHIAFAAQRDPDLGSSGTATIYTVAVADRAVKKIVDAPGPNVDPVWSPDGRAIAYATANGSQYYYYTNTVIAVVPSTGGAGRVLTAAFDENAAPLAWTNDGIYFGALQRTYAHLFRLDPATGATTRVTNPDGLIASQFSIARHAPVVAYVGAMDNGYAEVAVSSLAAFAPTVVTAMGDQYAAFKAARREIIRWKAADGAAIEGVLIEPAGFDPAKKYPLLVVIHGGPTGVDRGNLGADRYYPIEQFVAKGALVLRPNYRGSAGYGEKFRALNVRNLGVGDYADVISGVDYLVGKGWVDPKRVGAMGWSEGGYISAFITASSDRFRAVSVGAGISDWMTYYVNTDIHPFTRQYLHATPWDDPEIYRKTSPITYIKAAKTPTLIQHGGSDKRVPIPNGYELYQALRDKGVPVRMVVYPGFGHPIDKPKQQRSVMEENLKWFSHWIWDEPMPAAAVSTVSGR
jgi:dipeptidyl aminopeptidase/acylaminoacyl peptidase